MAHDARRDVDRTDRTLLCALEPASDRIACSLDQGGLQRRLVELRSVFGQGLVGRERLDEAVRWRFRSDPSLREELVRLAQAEHACCPFFRFDLLAVDDETWWEIRVPSGGEAVLDLFYELPAGPGGV